jgi:hypothetical protein
MKTLIHFVKTYWLMLAMMIVPVIGYILIKAFTNIY